MIPTASLPVLPIGCYRFVFEIKKPFHVPDYTGSLWRGAFGHALKRLVCVTHDSDCSQCMLYRTCTYPYIFETPPDPTAAKLRKYTAAPHPFVLDPELISDTFLVVGLEISLQMTLFGRGNSYLPYILQALNQAGQHGLGRDKGIAELKRMEQIEPGGMTWQCIWLAGERLVPRSARVPEIPPCPKELEIILETPLRLKTDEHNVSVAQFSFFPFFSSLLRRISLLTTFHTDTPLDTDFSGLTRRAHEIFPSSVDLHWHDWARYSSRQKARIPMGGLMGSIKLSENGTGANEMGEESLALFWPYLWLGQWTHAGKGATMGLGRYRIEITAH